jgi:hypothetical protein
MSALDAFVRAAFAPLWGSEQAMLGIARNFRQQGGSTRLAFSPQCWRPDEAVPMLGLHYNCSAFRLGATRATLNEATRCMVVMLDDLGDIPGKSKAPLDRVLALPSPFQPHAVIATRRDGEHVNCQACWFIVPVDVGAARALVRAAATAGLGDPGASGGVRWARPPGSVKIDGNGFAAEMIVANLSAPRIAIGALADALGVDGFMGAARAPSLTNNRGALPDAALVRAPSRTSNRGALPDAALVRAAVAAIANDLDRFDWVRLGLALKKCCGGPPALAEAEGLALFDDFSRRHDTYNEQGTRATWESFRPTGDVGFGTLARMARRCGWDLRLAQRDLQRAMVRCEGVGHPAVANNPNRMITLLEAAHGRGHANDDDEAAHAR